MRLASEWKNEKATPNVDKIAKCENFGSRKNPLNFFPVEKFNRDLLKCSNSLVQFYFNIFFTLFLITTSLFKIISLLIEIIIFQKMDECFSRLFSFFHFFFIFIYFF